MALHSDDWVESCHGQVEGHLCDLFQPQQLGLGTPKGAEIAVHVLRRYIEGNSNESDAMLKIDFKNAFNCIRRNQILTKVIQKVYVVTNGLAIICQCQKPLFQLLREGDPLGTFLFSLGIANLMKS